MHAHTHSKGWSKGINTAADGLASLQTVLISEMFYFQTKKKGFWFGSELTCGSVPASQQHPWCFSQRRCTSFTSRGIKIHEHTQYTCFTQCVFIQELVLGYGGGHYSHAVCQALKLPMTCRLTSQRPEKQQNTHMRTNSHICRAMAWCFPDAAPSFLPPTLPGTLALPNLWISPPTHTLTAPPTAHSTPLIKGFCFFNFPFPMQGPCTAVAAALAAREVWLPIRQEKHKNVCQLNI